MNITYTYTIAPDSLQTVTANGNPNTVVHLTVRVYATDGTHTVHFDRPMIFEPSADGAFIPFEQLTEAQVLSWARAKMPFSHTIEEALARRIAEKVNPPAQPVVKPAPWSTCTQPPSLFDDSA
jgi:hypothetical protein